MRRRFSVRDHVRSDASERIDPRLTVCCQPHERGASFVTSSRKEWERTFAVDWWGTYYCARTFLPLLIASGDGVLVNASSVNGFWASLGPRMPNSGNATAKLAVKGFTEALIEDLRTNAPRVRVALVMPGPTRDDPGG